MHVKRNFSRSQRHESPGKQHRHIALMGKALFQSITAQHLAGEQHDETVLVSPGYGEKAWLPSC